jgi:hypothetical protein
MNDGAELGPQTGEGSALIGRPALLAQGHPAPALFAHGHPAPIRIALALGAFVPKAVRVARATCADAAVTAQNQAP